MAFEYRYDSHVDSHELYEKPKEWLLKEARRVVNFSKRRIKQIDKYGLQSDAVDIYKQENENIRGFENPYYISKNMSMAELRQIIRSNDRFLKKQKSTVGGIVEFAQNIYDAMEKNEEKKLSVKDVEVVNALSDFDTWTQNIDDLKEWFPSDVIYDLIFTRRGNEDSKAYLKRMFRASEYYEKFKVNPNKDVKEIFENYINEE